MRIDLATQREPVPPPKRVRFSRFCALAILVGGLQGVLLSRPVHVFDTRRLCLFFPKLPHGAALDSAGESATGHPCDYRAARRRPLSALGTEAAFELRKWLLIASGPRGVSVVNPGESWPISPDGAPRSDADTREEIIHLEIRRCMFRRLGVDGRAMRILCVKSDELIRERCAQSGHTATDISRTPRRPLAIGRLWGSGCLKLPP